MFLNPLLYLILHIFLNGQAKQSFYTDLREGISLKRVGHKI